MSAELGFAASTKHALKRASFSLCAVVASPLALAAWLEKRLSRSEAVFAFGAQSLALIPGMIGTYLRGAYYYLTLDACSWETHVGFGSLFTHRGGTLGRHASMGVYCVIGHADIGEGVMMASRVSVPSGKRQHIDEGGRMSAEPRFDRVAIGRGCWVGEGATIMADVGERCIVSAGAVVAKRIPPGSLVAGNPATVVRQLDVQNDGVQVL